MKQEIKWYNKRAVVLVQPSYCYKQFKNACNLMQHSLQRTLDQPGFTNLLVQRSQRICQLPSLSITTVLSQWAQFPIIGLLKVATFNHLLSFQSAIRLIKQSIPILYQMGFRVLELHDWLNYRFRHELEKLDTIVGALYQPAVFRLRHDYPITLGSNCYFSDNLKRSSI